MAAFTVGLTGGVASGKTLVVQFFAELGVPVIEADEVSRAVVTPPSAALDQIRLEFGEQFLQSDGSLNRPLMRAHVFADELRRRRLEQILHPLMAASIQRWRQQRSEPYCILSAAILIESGMHRLVDRIVVVDVPVAMQLARLMARDGADEALARSMLASQLSREQRLQSADDVIDNSGSRQHSLEQVRRLHELYLRLSSGLGSAST